MATNLEERPEMRPRELGRRGTAGSLIAAFGMLWTMSYVLVMAWITSLLVDSTYYFWQFTTSFGWTILLWGVIVFGAGAGLMVSDWKRREPEPPAVAEKQKVTTGYEATHPQMEYHIEA